MVSDGRHVGRRAHSHQGIRPGAIDELDASAGGYGDYHSRCGLENYPIGSGPTVRPSVRIKGILHGASRDITLRSPAFPCQPVFGVLGGLIGYDQFRSGPDRVRILDGPAVRLENLSPLAGRSVISI